MAALLVSIAVMGVMMTMAMPVWRHAALREKEAELVFRGEQYARAIGLFQRKHPGAFPPNLDVLIEQKYLRRKYKDPMTKDGEFLLLYQTSNQPGMGGPGASRPGAVQRQGGAQADAEGRGGGVIAAKAGAVVSGAHGGVTGVASASKERSIRLYKGRQRYNEWQFVYTPVTQRAGETPGEGSGSGQPGMPGGIPGRPGVRQPGIQSRPGMQPRPPNMPGGARRPPP
ncbi:MAG: type II secretion system protein [Acidobacteria bacterium]|nr:type II secretion system protein [Acidobacteriota bacterium]